MAGEFTVFLTIKDRVFIQTRSDSHIFIVFDGKYL